MTLSQVHPSLHGTQFGQWTHLLGHNGHCSMSSLLKSSLASLALGLILLLKMGIQLLKTSLKASHTDVISLRTSHRYSFLFVTWRINCLFVIAKVTLY